MNIISDINYFRNHGGGSSMVSIIDTVYASINTTVGSTISYLPQLIGALMILIIGLIVGNIIGKIGSKILDKIGVDDAIEKTVVGDIIKTTKMSVVGFLDTIIKWFVYLIFIMASVEVLQMDVLSRLIERFVTYLPNLFSGLIVLIGGLIIIDVLAEWIGSIMTGMKVDGVKQLLLIIRTFMFLVITILAMDQLLIDTTIIYTFIGPLAWAAAIIVAFKYGIKDTLVAYAKEQKRK